MKYIDVEKLIEIIDSKLEELGMSGSVWVGRSVLRDLKTDIITSLQQEQPEGGCSEKPNNLLREQPEVDLGQFDKDVTKIWDRCAAEPNDSIACLHIETFNEVARHFYELGLNAIKKD